MEGRINEAEAVHGRADHCGSAGARGGAKAADLARKHGVSEATLYNWKAKYGGMDVSDAKRLKALEDENAKLKKLLADQMLEASALRDVRPAVSHYQKMYGPPRPCKGSRHRG